MKQNNVYDINDADPKLQRKLKEVQKWMEDNRCPGAVAASIVSVFDTEMGDLVQIGILLEK